VTVHYARNLNARGSPTRSADSIQFLVSSPTSCATPVYGRADPSRFPPPSSSRLAGHWISARSHLDAGPMQWLSVASTSCVPPVLFADGESVLLVDPTTRGRLSYAITEAAALPRAGGAVCRGGWHRAQALRLADGHRASVIDVASTVPRAPLLLPRRSRRSNSARTAA